MPTSVEEPGIGSTCSGTPCVVSTCTRSHSAVKRRCCATEMPRMRRKEPGAVPRCPIVRRCCAPSVENTCRAATGERAKCEVRRSLRQRRRDAQEELRPRWCAAGTLVCCGHVGLLRPRVCAAAACVRARLQAVVCAIGDEELAVGCGEVDAGRRGAELADTRAVRAEAAHKAELGVGGKDGDAVVARVGAIEVSRAAVRRRALVQGEPDRRVQLARRLTKRSDRRDGLRIGQRELVQAAVAAVGDICGGAGGGAGSTGRRASGRAQRRTVRGVVRKPCRRYRGSGRRTPSRSAAGTRRR
jgi:hypothetical protein